MIWYLRQSYTNLWNLSKLFLFEYIRSIAGEKDRALKWEKKFVRFLFFDCVYMNNIWSLTETNFLYYLFSKWLIKNNLKQNKSIVHSLMFSSSVIGTCRSTRKIKKIWIFAIDLGPFEVNLTKMLLHIPIFTYLFFLFTLLGIRIKEF